MYHFTACNYKDKSIESQKSNIFVVFYVNAWQQFLLLNFQILLR